MKTSDLFPSRYVKADDLDSGPQQVAIRELQIEEIGQGKDKVRKPVLYFQGRTKGLVLNVTNCRTIEEAYGDIESWPGKSIELYSTKVDFKGDRVDAVRVRAPKAPDPNDLVDEPPARPIRGGSSGGGAPDLNDEIPFAPLCELP